MRAYVAGLEQWIIRTLAAFNVRGERREDRVGVWVKRPDKGAGHEDKIAAIGVRLRRWVSFHGISINVEPDLTPFRGHRALRRGRPALRRHQPRRSRPTPTTADVDIALRQAFGEVFGRQTRLPEATLISGDALGGTGPRRSRGLARGAG